MVVFVHCVLPGQFGQYVIAYARFAVPFFILVSGWYAYHEDMRKVQSYCLRKLKDTCMLTVSAALLYFLWNSVNNYFSSGDAIGWLISYISQEDFWYNLIAYNRAVFLNSVMYYLLMMIYVYIIILTAVKLRILKHLKWFIPIGLVANYLLGAVFRAPWYHSGNFLLTALPFFLFGMQLRKWTEEKHLGSRILYITLTAGLVLTFIEAHFLGDIYCYIGTIAISLSIMLICMTAKKSIFPAWLASFGQHYSAYIFILHCGVRDTLRLFSQGADGKLFAWLIPFLSIIVSSMIGAFCRNSKR